MRTDLSDIKTMSIYMYVTKHNSQSYDLFLYMYFSTTKMIENMHIKVWLLSLQASLLDFIDTYSKQLHLQYLYLTEVK